MSSAIVSLILFALMITTGLTFSKVALNSVNDLSLSVKDQQQTRLDITRTNFALIRSDEASGVANIYLQNTGQVQLTDYQSWDIIAHYYDSNGIYGIKSLEYISGTIAGPNQWTVYSIFSNTSLTQGEIFQPGIVDPGEVAQLRINLSPAPGAGKPCWIIISTDNGLTGSIQFQG